ncbi:MAG: hypothetical protein ACKV2U_32170 [Bryobacteraceae bacterium]
MALAWRCEDLENRDFELFRHVLGDDGGGDDAALIGEGDEALTFTR